MLTRAQRKSGFQVRPHPLYRYLCLSRSLHRCLIPCMLVLTLLNQAELQVKLR